MIRAAKRRLLEAEVERTICDLMTAHGYLSFKTNASNKTRSGYPAFATGTLDQLFVHPKKSPVFAELKAERARTNAVRRVKQAKTAQDLRALGFPVYRAKDGDPDPIRSYTDWAMAEGVIA